MASRGVRQPMGAQDALWLEMDRPTNLMVVDSLVWTSSPIDWIRFEAIARERLWDRYPVFRSVAVRDGDDWIWDEDVEDDLGSHITRVELEAPGDDAALRRLVAEQRSLPLDRGRPLWSACCIDGYRGASAVLMRTHHAIADGIRLVQVAMSLFDATPEGGAILAPPVRLHAERTTSEQPATLTGRVLGEVRSAVGQVGGLATTSLTDPLGAAYTTAAESLHAMAALSHQLAATLRTRQAGTGPLVDMFSSSPGDIDFVRKLLVGTRNDRTIWTGPVGVDKHIAWTSPIPLVDVKAVARRHGATVNDVLVTAIAGALHAYLVAHDARCASATFMIPVNLKPLDLTMPDELGNEFAVVQLELPTDVGDPLAVLDAVRRRMRRIKQGHEAALAFRLQGVVSGLGGAAYRASVDLLANRATGVMTNVPGPPVPVYLAGEQVDGLVGWAPLSGDQPMSFTIHSYDGRVVVGVACDAGLVPDHDQLVDGIGVAFDRLAAAIP